MPSRRPIAPWIVAGLFVALLLGAGVTLWGGSGSGSDPAPYEPATAPLPPHRLPPDPGVAPHHCGVVTYTPRHAVEAHDADLCRPGRDARGAVILVHGGGGYSGDRSTMTEWSAWYRDHGFVTLSIDYTLLGQGHEPLYPLPENELKGAVQWARLQADRLGFDPERILLHGSSAGARLAAQVYVTPDEAWPGAPEPYPGVPSQVAGMIGFYGYYDGDTLEAQRYYGGGPHSRDPQVQERWRHADSVAQAGHASGPALLFHGDVDGLINVAQTERFGSALVEAGKDVTTVLVTDGDHAFDGRFGDLTTETGRNAAAEIADWLDTRFP